MRVLLDHNVPRQLARQLTGHEAKTASQMGWDRLANGELIARTDAAGFGVLITADQNLRYQQNFTLRALALVVLSTNRRRAIEANVGAIIAAIGTAMPGSITEVTCDA